jgi:multisubunit Na+/H+ antiporter MnhC subunit
MFNEPVTLIATVLASCRAGAPANCEDATDPMGMVIVLIAVLAGIALLTVFVVLGPDLRRRTRARRRDKR